MCLATEEAVRESPSKSVHATSLEAWIVAVPRFATLSVALLLLNHSPTHTPLTRTFLVLSSATLPLSPDFLFCEYLRTLSSQPTAQSKMAETMSETYKEEWIVGPSNTNFFTRFYPSTSSEPAKASFVFIHGFQEHIARYDHVFQRVQAAGYSVFAFDQRGWGQTALNPEHKSPTSSYGLTTRPQQLGDTGFFIKRESERLGKEVPLFLWGHSMVSSSFHALITSIDRRTLHREAVSYLVSEPPRHRRQQNQPCTCCQG